MFAVNYFQALCLVWATVGIGSRIAMAVMGPRWNSWETSHAYGEQRPVWIYAIGLLLLAAIPLTWYQVYTSGIAYSWILALLFSLTAIKVYKIIFQYDQFRSFVISSLASPQAMLKINAGVLLLSSVLLVLAFTLYA